MMKTIHAVAFGIGAFFALNCGSGEGGYGSSSSEPTRPSQSTNAAETDDETPASSAGATSGSVAVNGHSFDPPEVHIKAGEAVKWTWVAGSHNVVSGAACTPDGKFTTVLDVRAHVRQGRHVPVLLRPALRHRHGRQGHRRVS